MEDSPIILLAFPLALLIFGLLLIARGKKINNDIDELDANYLGDLIPDPDEEAMYRYERKSKVSNANACNGFGKFLIFWSIVFAIAILLD